MKECLICSRIELIKEGGNSYPVKELETGYVVLGDFQYYKGYALFLSKIHAEELHQLEIATMKKSIRNAESARPSNKQLEEMKKQLLKYLQSLKS